MLRPRTLFRRPARAHQRGLTLLESLVSILALALGVLGVLGTQLRTLSETRTGVHRAQAVRLIEDFAERIKSHPEGFSQLSAYAVAWEDFPEEPDCKDQACDAADLARYDLATWKQSVRAILPLGDARVFELLDEDEVAGTGRELGVLVGWAANELGSADDAYLESITAPPSDSGVDACPAGLICHLVHVQP